MHACDRSTLLDGRDERGAAAVAQAFAGAAVCERQHEAADGNVGELRQDNVGTGTDLLGRLLVAELLDERGDQPLYAQAMRGLIGSDVVEPRLDEVADTLLDLVPDLAHPLEWLAGWVVPPPVLDLRGNEGAACLAVEGDRPVGVQLHLEVELLRVAVADVDPDLAHRLDHVRPDRSGGLLSGGLGAGAGWRGGPGESLR